MNSIPVALALGFGWQILLLFAGRSRSLKGPKLTLAGLLSLAELDLLSTLRSELLRSSEDRPCSQKLREVDAWLERLSGRDGRRIEAGLVDSGDK
ncbi:MAG: hypothetical protein QXP65_01855 [Candidatus Hadarchaeales archaeon]